MTYFPVSAPYQIFNDLDGEPLEAGYIYIGIAYQNPISNPISTFWDVDGLYPAAQPIRTIGGYPSRNGSAAKIFVNAGAFEDYSILINDKQGKLVFSAQSALSNIIASGNNVDLLDDLRDISGYNQPIYVRGHSTIGDGGQGPFEWYDGAAPGTYIDDDGITAVPTGGDGSGAWIRPLSGFVYVGYYGIDETNDSSSQLTAAAAAAQSLGLPLTAPNLLYIDNDVTLRSVVIDFKNTGITCRSGAQLIIGGDSDNPIGALQKIKRITRDGGVTATPTCKVMGSKGYYFDIVRCDYLQLYADSDDSSDDSIAYCTFYLGYIGKLELNTNPTPAGSTTQWINENNFYLNRVVNLLIDGTYNHNHNIFYRGTFEAGASIDVQIGSQNNWIDVRGENSLTINFESAAYENVIEFGWTSSNSRWEALPTITDAGRHNVVKHRQHVISENYTIVGFDYQTLKNPDTDVYNVQNVDNLTVGASSLTASTFKIIYTTPIFYTLPRACKFQVQIWNKITGGIRIRVRGYDSSGISIASTGADVYYDGTGNIGFGLDNVGINTSNSATFWIINEDTSFIEIEVRTGGTATEFEGLSIVVHIPDIAQRRRMVSSLAAQCNISNLITADAQADSVAADVPSIVSDFNDLLAKLRVANLIAT